MKPNIHIEQYHRHTWKADQEVRWASDNSVLLLQQNFYINSFALAIREALQDNNVEVRAWEGMKRTTCLTYVCQHWG